MSRPDFDWLAEVVSLEQLARVIGAKQSGGKKFHCPSDRHEHGDRNPSLDIDRVNGRTLVLCRSCGLKGTPVQVAAELWGMTLNDAAERLVSELGLTTATQSNCSGTSGSGLGELIATYDYHDEHGEYQFSVRRYAFPKDFRQGRRQGQGGWAWGRGGTPDLLYRLPEVVVGVKADRHILIVEGEKDADLLAEHNFVATTCPGGAGKWRECYSEDLKGARVCVLPDADDAGRKHAQAVAQSLHGVAAELRVLELPDLPSKGDVSDWFAAGGTNDELKALVRGCPIWEAPANDQGELGPRVRCMADVEPEEVTWLWGSRIPRGKLTEIVGDPGVGKSTLTTEIVASVSNGTALPGDGFSVLREPADVLLLSAEDGAGDTIRPRLDRAGAEVSRVHLFEGIEGPNDDLAPFDLKNALHRHHLAALIEELGVGLLVIDPLTAYLGGGDSHKDAEVRGVLMPLAEIAESSGCAVLTVRHLNKGSTSRAIYRAGGSIAFTAAARSSLLVGQVEEGSDERAIVTIKSNLAAFPPPVGFSLEGGRFKWATETPDVAATDLLRPESDSDERSDRSETVEWLLALLRQGPKASVDVFKMAKAELSVSEVTVRRAKRALGDAVEVYRKSDGNTGDGQWSWRVSQDDHPSPDHLAKSESDHLARTVIPQGFPASEGSQHPQDGHDNGRDHLADSDNENGLFHDLSDEDLPVEDRRHLEDERAGMQTEALDLEPASPPSAVLEGL